MERVTEPPCSESVLRSDLFSANLKTEFQLDGVSCTGVEVLNTWF